MELNNTNSQPIGLFLPLRLATYVILMGVVILGMGGPKFLNIQIITYSIITLGFAISLSLSKRYKLGNITRLLSALQFLLELSIECGVVYATGSVNSPFVGLFILTIVSAAIVYRMTGTLVIATLASGSYAMVVWLSVGENEALEFSTNIIKTIFSANGSIFYGIFLHILIFFLAALMSGYLAERLNRQDKSLADASTALKQARLETDEILRHLNSGLLTVNAQGSIIFFNRAAEKILGYDEIKVRGMSCKDVFDERMPELATYLLNSLTSGVVHLRREIDIIDAKGISIPLGLSGSILTQEDGELRGMIAIFSDLTDAKLMEQKVRANDRLAAIGELSASIAHEIRNPLAAIAGSVEILSRELTLVNENERLMGLITKESLRLNKILTDFLSYARMERPAFNKVELCHIIGDVRELLRLDDSISSDIEISLESDEDIVYVVGDADLIKQLVMNLAINACDAQKESGGTLKFRVLLHPDTRTVELYVSDSGPGIDSNIIDRVYEPFYSTKKAGTGLGLAIVHRIADALSLRLQLHSISGDGTTFIVGFKRYDLSRYQLTETAV